jgi:hypothetical protein
VSVALAAAAAAAEPEAKELDPVQAEAKAEVLAPHWIPALGTIVRVRDGPQLW